MDPRSSQSDGGMRLGTFALTVLESFSSIPTCLCVFIESGFKLRSLAIQNKGAAPSEFQAEASNSAVNRIGNQARTNKTLKHFTHAIGQVP